MELCIDRFTLEVLLLTMIIRKKIERACSKSCRIQLFGGSIIKLFCSCQPKPVQSVKFTSNASVRRIVIAMNTNLPFTGSYSKNPFRDQHFDIRQNRNLKGNQQTANFDAAEKCCRYVTSRKTLSFLDDIHSFPIDEFKNHYVVVFDLTSMHFATSVFHTQSLMDNQWDWS